MSVKRYVGALVALALSPFVLAQSLPTPNYQTPSLADSSTRGATTSFVQQLFARIGVDNVKFYGAACNGTTDDSAALAAAASAVGSVRIPGGCTIRASNVTVRAPLTIDRGGFLKVDAAATATVRGAFTAPWEQVFNGAGSVVGITVSRPVWRGAHGLYGNTYDSRNAIQAAITSANASYDPSTPTDYSAGRRPTVEFGTGFYRACSPIDIYPNASKPITIKGPGVFNTMRLDACSTFSGYALLNIHGVLAGGDGSWDVEVRDILLGNPTRASGVTAGIRFVPEGAGYALNSGNVRPSLFQNILLQGFPTGLDIVNTLQAHFDRITYQGSGNSNNLGVYIRTAGSGVGAHSGEFIFSSLQSDPCPVHDANICTNTTGVQIEAASANSDVASVTFENNTILWGSDTPFRLRATGGTGSFIRDIWLRGAQMDGFSCNFIDAISDAAGSAISNIHVDHNYHTGSASTGCTTYGWTAQNGGVMNNIWVTNNQFVLGPSGPVVLLTNVQDAVVSGNVMGGGGNSAAIFVNINSQRVVVANNIIRQVNPSWISGIALSSTSTDYLSVTGNVLNGMTTGIINSSGGTHNVVANNAGP